MFLKEKTIRIVNLVLAIIALIFALMYLLSKTTGFGTDLLNKILFGATIVFFSINQYFAPH